MILDMKQITYISILLVLATAFIVYNFVVYTQKEIYGNVVLSEKAFNGQNLWLNNNCNSCHQIYGLGGYLGPDLTNVYSFRKKNDSYIKAMFNSGTKSMPVFHFTEIEKDELLQFLIEVDQTGISPNPKAQIDFDGWVNINANVGNHE